MKVKIVVVKVYCSAVYKFPLYWGPCIPVCNFALYWGPSFRRLQFHSLPEPLLPPSTISPSTGALQPPSAAQGQDWSRGNEDLQTSASPALHRHSHCCCCCCTLYRMVHFSWACLGRGPGLLAGIILCTSLCTCSGLGPQKSGTLLAHLATF